MKKKYLFYCIFSCFEADRFFFESCFETLLFSSSSSHPPVVGRDPQNCDSSDHWADCWLQYRWFERPQNKKPHLSGLRWNDSVQGKSLALCVLLTLFTWHPLWTTLCIWIIVFDNIFSPNVFIIVLSCWLTQEVIPNWQKAASNILVAVGNKHINEIMEEILSKFQPGVLPHFFVVQTLANLSDSNGMKTVTVNKLKKRNLPLHL